VLDLQSARALVLRQCETLNASSLATETVPLTQSYRRILAEAIVLDQDQPPFDRAMRDGYALRTEDLVELPVDLKCVGETRAGYWPAHVVTHAETMQIMTGAPVPAGADSVVMIENTEPIGDGRVRILKRVGSGENISRRGSEKSRGETVARPGTLISGFELAGLAAVGKSSVKVYQRTIVSVLPTGDELTEVDQQPLPGRIRNTNSYSLLAQILDSGAQPELLALARDSEPDLCSRIEEGLKNRVLVISGGVSVGKYDLVEKVLLDHGAQIHFESVSIRPGKPAVFATLGETFVFGLPGNPVSTFVTFEVFVRPLLNCLQGLQPGPLPIVHGVLLETVVDKSGRTSFLPAVLTSRHERLEVLPVGWKGSADIFSLSGVNSFLIVPEVSTRLEKGSKVEALLFSKLQFS
jgi:molybdopterin molybdotransferase